MALTLAGTIGAGCANTVSGNARPTPQRAGEGAAQFGYVDNRCGLLSDITVQQLVGGRTVVRSYSGAVCQYVIGRGPEFVDVTYSWFPAGSLSRERQLATGRRAEITDTVVERRTAFLARRSITGAACSATAAASPDGGPGVLSWWVQLRGQAQGDPCADAVELLSATLSAEM